MVAESKRLVCENCGAEADMVLEGFESVEDVVKKKKKNSVCKNCGRRSRSDKVKGSRSMRTLRG